MEHLRGVRTLALGSVKPVPNAPRNVSRRVARDFLETKVRGAFGSRQGTGLEFATLRL